MHTYILKFTVFTDQGPSAMVPVYMDFPTREEATVYCLERTKVLSARFGDVVSFDVRKSRRK